MQSRKKFSTKALIIVGALMLTLSIIAITSTIKPSNAVDTVYAYQEDNVRHTDDDSSYSSNCDDTQSDQIDIITRAALIYNRLMQLKGIENADTVQCSNAILVMMQEITKIQNETIIEELDEFVWTINDAELYEGADNTYPVIEPVSKNTKLYRIGMCKNGYSVILRDNEQVAFTHSDNLTTTAPVIFEPGDKSVYQEYAWSLFSEYGWSENEFEPLVILWNRESNWNPYAENKSSGAYGIPQSLPASKMASVGDDYLTNYKTQIRWGLNYIAGRYGTPTEALNHSYSTGWY